MFDFSKPLTHKTYNFTIQPDHFLLIDLANKTLTFKHKGSIMKTSFNNLEQILDLDKSE